MSELSRRLVDAAVVPIVNMYGEDDGAVDVAEAAVSAAIDALAAEMEPRTFVSVRKLRQLAAEVRAEARRV